MSFFLVWIARHERFAQLDRLGKVASRPRIVGLHQQSLSLGQPVGMRSKLPLILFECGISGAVRKR